MSCPEAAGSAFLASIFFSMLVLSILLSQFRKSYARMTAFFKFAILFIVQKCAFCILMPEIELFLIY